MISRNETASKKAKFWQSYVGSLKGSEDLRAPDSTYSRSPRGIYKPLPDYPSLSSSWDTWPYGKSIYDDPSHAGDRVNVPGYRYDPLHRDIYGYSPRKLYPHNYGYNPLDRYRPAFHLTKLKPSVFDADQAWADHLARKAERAQPPNIFDNFHTTYPFSRYPLYLVHGKKPQPIKDEKFDPHRNWLDHLNRLNDLDRLNNLFPKSLWSPTPIKVGDYSPRPNEVAFNYFGQPIYTRGGLRPTAVY